MSLTPMYYNSITDEYLPWEWLAASAGGTGGTFYAVGSGFVSSLDGDMHSGIWAVSKETGVITGTYQFTGDMFNSAPLFVGAGDESGSGRVFVTTTNGYVYCFDGGNSALEGRQGRKGVVGFQCT